MPGKMKVVCGLLALTACSPKNDSASEQPQVPAAGTSSPAAVPTGKRGQDGDTVMLFIHHVKPDKRAEYEKWFSGVWEPAMRAVAQKRQSARQLMMGERDFRPTQASEDGDYIYAYLYDPWVTDTGGQEGRFPTAMLIEAGRSAEDAKKEAEAFDSFVRKTAGHMFVQRQF